MERYNAYIAVPPRNFMRNDINNAQDLINEAWKESSVVSIENVTESPLFFKEQNPMPPNDINLDGLLYLRVSLETEFPIKDTLANAKLQNAEITYCSMPEFYLQDKKELSGNECNFDSIRYDLEELSEAEIKMNTTYNRTAQEEKLDLSKFPSIKKFDRMMFSPENGVIFHNRPPRSFDTKEDVMKSALFFAYKAQGFKVPHDTIFLLDVNESRIEVKNGVANIPGDLESELQKSMTSHALLEEKQNETNLQAEDDDFEMDD